MPYQTVAYGIPGTAVGTGLAPLLLPLFNNHSDAISSIILSNKHLHRPSLVSNSFMSPQGYHCATPPIYSITFNVHPITLGRSRNQHFYIIPNGKHSSTDGTFLITGLFGNLYRVTLTKDYITCSCDDKNSSPCKHILFILRAIGYNFHTGITFLEPHQLLANIQSTRASMFHLDLETTSLCLSHNQNNCLHCKHPLLGTISSCNQCGTAYHHGCIVHSRFCNKCNRKTVFLNTPLINRHRNLYNILSYRKYPLTSQPPNKNIIQNIRPQQLPTSPTFHNNETQAEYFQSNCTQIYPRTPTPPKVNRQISLNINNADNHFIVKCV